MPVNKPTGQALLANYQTVIVSQATIDAARYEAERSEQELVQHLQNISSNTYLQPSALATDNQEAISHASLDAHIKKVQADQLDSMNTQQLMALQQETYANYVGKKALITVRLPQLQPVETVWFDQRNGYRSAITKKKQFKGIIQEVILDKNALVLRPTMGSQLIFSSLHSYIVYVIDPETSMPMVDIQML